MPNSILASKGKKKKKKMDENLKTLSAVKIIFVLQIG